MIPATVSAAPATRSQAPRRVRTDRARRISPMTASSAPVRIHLRIRLVRTCCASLGAPYLPAGTPDELHTTRFFRCNRTLMHLAALCIPHGTPVNHTIEIPVEPGHHTLQVRNGRNSSSTQTFDAAEVSYVFLPGRTSSGDTPGSS
jgi:hypothetical protein